jgi:hypothetical protein
MLESGHRIKGLDFGFGGRWVAPAKYDKGKADADTPTDRPFQDPQPQPQTPTPDA